MIVAGGDAAEASLAYSRWSQLRVCVPRFSCVAVGSATSPLRFLSIPSPRCRRCGKYSPWRENSLQTRLPAGLCSQRAIALRANTTSPFPNFPLMHRILAPRHFVQRFFSPHCWHKQPCLCPYKLSPRHRARASFVSHRRNCERLCCHPPVTVCVLDYCNSGLAPQL